MGLINNKIICACACMVISAIGARTGRNITNLIFMLVSWYVICEEIDEMKRRKVK